jgi:hypothetical protein
VVSFICTNFTFYPKARLPRLPRHCVFHLVAFIIFE